MEVLTGDPIELIIKHPVHDVLIVDYNCQGVVDTPITRHIAKMIPKVHKLEKRIVTDSKKKRMLGRTTTINCVRKDASSFKIIYLYTRHKALNKGDTRYVDNDELLLHGLNEIATKHNKANIIYAQIGGMEEYVWTGLVNAALEGTNHTPVMYEDSYADLSVSK